LKVLEYDDNIDITLAFLSFLLLLLKVFGNQFYTFALNETTWDDK
jgi:hypothetical protein